MRVNLVRHFGGKSAELDSVRYASALEARGNSWPANP